MSKGSTSFWICAKDEGTSVKSNWSKYQEIFYLFFFNINGMVKKDITNLTIQEETSFSLLL